MSSSISTASTMFLSPFHNTQYSINQKRPNKHSTSISNQNKGASANIRNQPFLRIKKDTSVLKCPVSTTSTNPSLRGFNAISLQPNLKPKREFRSSFDCFRFPLTDRKST